MGRAPCCEKDSVKRGPWTPEEDAKLLACISQHGTGNWRTLPKKAGLQRCGKSCRLRWTNYLRPDLKHGRFTEHEEHLIVKLHAALGSRWSLIAAQLPGRTDNDVKNYWNTRLKKKLCEMGIDPITHKPISQLLADLATSIALPSCPSLNVDNSHHVNGGQGSGGGGGGIAEATLGYFKDDMLNVLLTRKNKPPTNYNNNPSLGLHHVTLPCLPSTPPPPPLFDAFFQPHVPPRGPVGGIRSQAAIMAARGKATVVTSDHTPSYFQQLGALPDTLLMQQGGFDLGTFSSIFPEDHQLYASLLQQQQHQYHQHQHQNQHHYQHQQQVEINDIVVPLPMHNILMESNKNNDYPTIESMTWSPSSSTSCTSLPPPAPDIGPNNSTDALLLDFSDLDHMMSSSNEQPTRNR